jgi:hypothetical protein
MASLVNMTLTIVFRLRVLPSEAGKNDSRGTSPALKASHPQKERFTSVVGGVHRLKVPLYTHD